MSPVFVAATNKCLRAVLTGCMMIYRPGFVTSIVA
jgi:hypothetical protein